MFQDSHLSLVDWFRIMWFISNQKFGLTAMELHKSLGISYSTGWNILRKLRKAMVPAGGELLTGTVEVDEAFIGGLIDGAKGDSKTSNQVLVVMAAELDGKSIGRVRVQQIPSATEENLFDFIRSSLKIGTTVITDGWMGYQGLGNNGYLHKVKIMNQEKKALPNIHKMVTLMKRWLLGSLKKFPNKEYLDYYLDEYTFRFNHRRAIMGGQMFLRLVEKALITPPLMREDIRARNIEEQKLFFELPMSNQDIPLF
jgi:transposase-like protein